MKDNKMQKKAEEIYKKYKIPTEFNLEPFEIWQVTPLKDGMIIFYESC